MTTRRYELGQELFRNEWHVLHRAQRREDGKSILIKVPARSSLHGAGVEALKREYEILQRVSTPGIPRPLGLVDQDGSLCLVVEDSGGTPLKELQHPDQGDLRCFFCVGAQVSDILTELHRRDIVHRGLHPRSILVQPATYDVSVVDFSLASSGPVEGQALLSTRLLLSQLPYMSPEQTGRMNRATDYRSDLYSLGVILYEVLTGLCPFRSDDPLEMVHRHIAQNPPPPHAVAPGVPEPLSDIVMKLLAKTAEQRYQSALGLKKDLEICLREWSAHQHISSFTLAQHDVADRFLIPQKLYGRDKEVQELVRAFDHTCEGPTALLLVTGYSGIGKTSLIQEIYRPIVQQRGYFIAGKFDLMARNIPFGAPVQAFRGLVQQLLTEGEDRLTVWRARLSQALGANAGVLTEVIPEVELILGKQPPPLPLGPTEARNRFRIVFQHFVSALSTREHPLVVFLDDLQWADPATLDLLRTLVDSPDVRYLFLIGAYRDNEVDATHPLSRALQALEAEGAQILRFSLGPLTLGDLTLFVRDMLHGDSSHAEPLARVVLQKTKGNPFFVIQFLKTLREEGLLQFDYAQGRWGYQLEAITRAGVTDNVIDLMTRKIGRLSSEAREALTLAACVGNQFDLATLATVSQQAAQAAASNLSEAVDEGLLLQADGSYDVPSHPTNESAAYAFLHDRVQQAAYALIPNDRKQLVHLTVGRLMRDRWDPDTAEERLFDLVYHLNLGSPLIVDEAERLGVAELNLNAGRKAKTSAAYQGALEFFNAGLGLLAEKDGDSRYELTFALHLEAADCEYLCGNFDRSERYFDLLLGRARSPLDKARVHALRTVQYENMSRFADAVHSGREGLAVFRVSLPDTEEGQRAALEAEMREIGTLLGGCSIASLIDLPLMADIEVRTVMRILMTMWAPSYLWGEQALTRLISATMVRLSLAHGNSAESAYGYVTYAITVGSERGDYKTAHEFGSLALALNERLGDVKLRAKIHQQFHAHVNLWRRPLKTCLPHAREAYRSGLETGDFTYAAYGVCTETWHALWTCPDLARFVDEYSGNVPLLRKLKMSGFVDAQEIMLRWALALQGLTHSPTSLSGDGFDEEAYAAAYASDPFMTTFIQVAKLQLCFTFEEYERAQEAARLAETTIRSLGGTIWPVLLDFWTGLTSAALYSSADEQEQRRYWDGLVRRRDSLKVLEENCPENFRCFSLLLTAEMERVSGRLTEAHHLYEEAIAYAGETENLLNEALADELFARFWLNRGQPKFGGQFVAEARNCYERWGAHAKVQSLERKYLDLLRRQPVTTRQPGTGPARATDGQEPVSLDLSTVLKAARAMAVEIDLDSLLRKLMQIALENAGAQRGVFIQEKEGCLVIEAESSVEGETRVRHSIPLEQRTNLSQAVVRYVRRTVESAVIGNAAADERFSTDPYVISSRPRSILCVPVVYEGKLGGILYLENNLTTDAFTPARTEMMGVLSTTAAISLEKARLYDEMKQEVARRREAEEAQRASEEFRNRIISSSRDCIKVLDLDGRLVFMNEGGMQALEICDFVAVRNSSWIEFWQGEDRPAVREALEAARGGQVGRFVGFFPTVQTGQPKWWEVVVSAILNSEGKPERLLAISRDVTERRRAEERERTLLEINNAIISNLIREDLFLAVSKAVRRLVPFDASAIYLHGPSKGVLRLFILESSMALPDFVTGQEIAVDDTPAGVVFKSRQPLLRRNLESERQFRTEHQLFAQGFRSLLIAPLVAQGKAVGTLNLGSTKYSQYSDADADFLQEVATQVALAIENMKSYEEIAALKARLEAENVYLQDEIRTEHNFVEIVGNSPALLAVLRKVEQIAPTDSTVLILGETGTGKELIARAIHDRSTRKGRPLVKVNCSAISAGLVESELFGHVKGAFTGAIDRRSGRFELADGGTIFLDEIGELPLETQVKLLRVLQEQEFEPVGSSRTVRVDVRIIAATNRDLEEAVRTGRFRSDLYYRLNVFPLYMPPLRERRSDIPPLVAFFLERVSKRFGKTIEGVSQATMRRLSEYAWPGNIRELQNIVERGVVLSHGRVLALDPGLLPIESAKTLAAAPGAVGEAVVEDVSVSHPKASHPPSDATSLEEVERQHILAVLKQTGGVVEGPKGAAKILNLHPNTLRSRMKRLGIPTRRPRHEIS
jgi:Nif-specific regulatory protein